MLIDAPIDQKTIRPFFADAPLAILITHSHHDHILYLDQYQNLYPDLIILGHQDSPLCKKYNFKPLKDKSTIKIGIFIFNPYILQAIILIQFVLNWTQFYSQVILYLLVEQGGYLVIKVVLKVYINLFMTLF